MFVGPTLFGNHAILSFDELKNLTFISELALAFIAFSIGSEFVVKDLAKYGKKVFIITIAEVLGAIILVFCLMYFVVGKPFAFSIVIAAMSAATAPAATLLVIRQYKAYGPVTKTLLSVVALDDVVGIIAFGVALSLAKMSIDEAITKNHFGTYYEIFGSLFAWFYLGSFYFVAKKQREHNKIIFKFFYYSDIIGIGFSNLLNLSPFLPILL